MLCEHITEVEYEEEYEVELLEDPIQTYALNVSGTEVCRIWESENAFVVAVSHNEAEGKLLVRCC